MSKRLPSPSMLIALAALVMATTGSAIAAKHYLITSTKQIKPSVLTKLKGNRGPRGLTGLQGVTGATGVTGANGTTGANGLGLTADQTLPSGATEIGAYAAAANSFGDRRSVVFDMRPKLPAAIAIGNVGIVPPGGASTADCPGTAANPAAAAGHLCIYETLMTNMSLSSIQNIDASGSGAGTRGAVFYMSASGSSGSAQGLWAVTAP